MEDATRTDAEQVLPGWQELADSVAQELTAWRKAPPHATLVEIETAVYEAVQRLQARALDQVVHASALADVRAHPEAPRPTCPECGGVLALRGRKKRTVRPARQRAALNIERTYAVCSACGAGLFPLNEELALLPGELSATLAEGLARLGTRLPFEQAAEHLAFFWGTEVEQTTVRRHTEAAGVAYVQVQSADLEELERAPVAPVDGPAVQFFSVDGAMVPLLHHEWAEVKTLALGTVQACPTDVDPERVRTTDLSYFSRLTDAETFTRLAYGETHRRGTERAEVVCAVQDGAEWLQGLVDMLRPDAVRILDFPHPVEHLTAAATPLLGSGTPALATWLDAQAPTLKHTPDGAYQVLTALARLPVQEAADPLGAREKREGAVAYFTKRLAQVQYATFRAQGYPIGSGSVESANKLVVEARLKGSGMHWARAHIDPLVALRTVAYGGRWTSVWPTITAQQCAAARHRRPARQRPSPLPRGETAPPPVPTPVPLCVASLPSSPARSKLVVNGRPSAWHPWKRSLLFRTDHPARQVASG